jgi:hypothetical protein
VRALFSLREETFQLVARRRGLLRRRRRLLHSRLASRCCGRLSRWFVVSAGIQEPSNQERKQRNKKFFHSVNHRYIISSPQALSADVIN